LVDAVRLPVLAGESGAVATGCSCNVCAGVVCSVCPTAAAASAISDSGLCDVVIVGGSPLLQAIEQKIAPRRGKNGLPNSEDLHVWQQKHCSVACQCCPS